MVHYYSEEQEGEKREGKLLVWIKGRYYELYTLSGIFSWRKLDKGTKLLAENMIIKKGWRVLDMGCGYGILGIVAWDRGAKEVVFVDRNPRAVEAASVNKDKYGVKGDVIQSNLYENVKGKFNTIISNPPITAGMETCLKLIEGAKKHLKKGGLLQIVARHKKGGKRLMEKIMEVFGNCEVLAKRGGYWLYLSKNF
ncbi:16S rRNA methyltransferase [Nanoarchaeota archaeon]|nr:MAG: 16S rRNA methyltransferase [Nanoarchaeota archaeon]